MLNHIVETLFERLFLRPGSRKINRGLNKPNLNRRFILMHKNKPAKIGRLILNQDRKIRKNTIETFI